MTTGLIAWNDGLLRALLHGVMANIPQWSFSRRWVAGFMATAAPAVSTASSVPAAQYASENSYSVPGVRPG